MSGIGSYDLAIVLGSGWREGAAALGIPSSEILASSLSGFVAPTVAGHNGQLLSVRVGDKNVLLVAGRVHLYEGNTADQVVHPVRTVDRRRRHEGRSDQRRGWYRSREGPRHGRDNP